MTDAEDLARRCLALWQDYVITLLADLATPEVLRHWAADCSARMGDPGPGDQSGRGQLPAGEPAVGTATAPGSAATRAATPKPRDRLAPVHGWFTEGFDTRDLKEAKALLDELAYRVSRQPLRGSLHPPAAIGRRTLRQNRRDHDSKVKGSHEVRGYRASEAYH
jgi:hypothetical protein